MQNTSPVPENIPVPHPSSPLFVDHTGRKFQRLTVIHYAGKRHGSRGAWFCRCDCGKELVALASNLMQGYTKSCGCLDVEKTIERSTKHGNAGRLVKSPEYKIWTGLKNRCTNPKNHCFKDYGGRGITICERWMEFQPFLDDMGPIPSPDHSIDRKDNSKGYDPSNCRWATKIEQANNKRNNLIVEMDGVRKTLVDWCRELSLNYGTVIMRIRSGLTPQEAFEIVPCGKVYVSAKIGVDDKETEE